MAIHNNPDLSDVEKFSYLKSLERFAEEAIAGLTLSVRNYCQTVEILMRQFGNRDKIIA